jgi:hypothetical protein
MVRRPASTTTARPATIETTNSSSNRSNGKNEPSCCGDGGGFKIRRKIQSTTALFTAAGSDRSSIQAAYGS